MHQCICHQTLHWCCKHCMLMTWHLECPGNFDLSLLLLLLQGRDWDCDTHLCSHLDDSLNFALKLLQELRQTWADFQPPPSLTKKLESLERACKPWKMDNALAQQHAQLRQSRKQRAVVSRR